MMVTLSEALAQTSWRLLLVIGRRRGLSLSSNIRKAELAGRLAQALLDPANLHPALAALTPPALAALADMVAAGGTIFLPYLAARHGQLRPPQQTPGHYHSPGTITALSELSPLEQLRALGLIFFDQASQQVFIPTDLLPLLAAELPVEAEPDLPINFSQPSPATLELAAHDLATFLALLQREPPALLQGRWLPPRFLKLWADHCRVPPALAQPASELQTGRRRFLHYLAESAGFIPAPLPASSRVKQKNKEPEMQGQRIILTPTPTGGLWLQASYAERLQRLWLAWSQPEPARWLRYQLPGAEWLAEPADLLQPLHTAIATVDRLVPGPFTRRLLREQPQIVALLPVTVTDRFELLSEIIVKLLSGPLSWLGILEQSNWEKFSQAGQPVEPASPPLYLSRYGRAWLAGETPLFDALAAAKFVLTVHSGVTSLDSFLSLELQAGLPDPADLATAIETSVPGPPLAKDGKKGQRSAERKGPPVHFWVTSASFIRALQRGWSPPSLIAALNQLAGRLLGQPEVELLKSWTGAAQRMVIYPATILEVTEPEILARLASSRRGRPLIHRTLSPRAVMVNPHRLEQLIQRLTEQEGIPPLRQGSRGAGEQGGKEHLSPTPLSLHAPAHLWLALRVYQALGQYLPLPVRLPQTAFDQIVDLVSPADLAGTQVAVEQIVGELQRALAGRVAFPPWPEEGLPEVESLVVIEQALAAGQNLELLYHAAGTDTLTRRVVEPYRIEWRGGGAGGQGSGGAEEQGGSEEGENRKSKIQTLEDTRMGAKSGTPYLVGFCHHTQAERTFRLDRIREIMVSEQK